MMERMIRRLGIEAGPVDVNYRDDDMRRSDVWSFRARDFPVHYNLAQSCHMEFVGLMGPRVICDFNHPPPIKFLYTKPK